MAAPEKKSKKPQNRGNYVSEWYGYRVYPVVAESPQASLDQHASRCSFLSAALQAEAECAKTAEASKGICTISSSSNGHRQDWPVCPVRILDPALLAELARLLFQYDEGLDLSVVASTAISNKGDREALKKSVLDGKPTVIFFHEKLGGEIRLPKTDASPEFLFDLTMVEMIPKGGGVALGRYGIAEIQTMDFHGSYKHVSLHLNRLLEEPVDGLRESLQGDTNSLGLGVETPNISNVFKRTFYQMMFKFQIGRHEQAAGCVFVISRSVWESWQRHLGAPELEQRPDGTWWLGESDEEMASNKQPPAWLYVFDIDISDTFSPNAIRPWRTIATDAKSLSRYALDIAPEAALGGGGSNDRLLQSIDKRLSKFWPKREREGSKETSDRLF